MKWLGFAKSETCLFLHQNRGILSILQRKLVFRICIVSSQNLMFHVEEFVFGLFINQTVSIYINFCALLTILQNQK